MTPLATYRIQLHGQFTFDDARAVAPYIAKLGVSHVYCSPYLQAAKGSTHGYDVVDHNRVNEELGGEEAHAEFVEELKHLKLGQVLDIVPNHMAVGERGNRWWWDVLENGPSSPFASYFDVDWEPPEARLHNLVLVPILGDHYGRVLENGELTLVREGGKFVWRYFENTLPVAPKSMGDALTRAATLCDSDQLAFLADALRLLPSARATDLASLSRRHRDKEVISRQLAELCSGEPVVAQAIDRVLNELNRDPDAVDAIMALQNFRLAWWRTAGRELGYRRFFDINTLAGVRAEDPHVFQATHARVFQWLREGLLDGIRIDHPDGLRDPAEYFRRLRQAFPDAWIVAEKILEPGEELRKDWPVAGTTGYDFLYRVDSLLVDPAGEEPLTRLYTEFTGCSSNYDELVLERKHQLLRGTLGADVNRLTAQFMDVCERHRRYRDFTRHDIHHALREVIACMPVYRTYVRAETREVHDDDRKYVNEAIGKAKSRRPDLDADLFDFLGATLLLDITGDQEVEFVMRFQQFTGPAMAKGVEDTSFYVYNRLSSLNEVGGNPGHFGLTLDDFHRAMTEAQERWPEAMLATSTHDTKRSEDVRCRIHLLAEIPEDWRAAVQRWSEHNGRHRSGDWPDRNSEYLLYQTLLGAWPAETDRIVNYMEKASREAKTYTSWIDPDPKYDEALKRFVTGVLADDEFRTDFERFVRPLIWPGRINSLTQTLIRMTAPGVPDIYQGTEIWTTSLVDPDNRRPVDYSCRTAMLDDLVRLTPEQMLERCEEGYPKLNMIMTALEVRRACPRAFG
ncbi:MAG TPA: malto-oligosyltrehalose synthase, partial [Bryobacteraceae bacterium]|nr:malto-oligosyltrehalose synthase [Bryobacteraceae bacterium]